MWGAIPTDECVESASENPRNAFYISGVTPDFPRKLKFLVPKVLLFIAILLLACLIMVIAARLSAEESEKSNPEVASLVQGIELTPGGDKKPIYQPSNPDVNETSLERPKRILVLRSIPPVKEARNLNGVCGNDTNDFCIFTYNQSEISNADAVIFQGIKSNENDIFVNYSSKLPVIPPSNLSQVWIFKVMQPSMPSWYGQYKNFSNFLTANNDFQSNIPYLTSYYKDGNISETKQKTTDSKIIKVAVYNKDCQEEENFFKKHDGAVNSLVKNNIIVDFYRYSYTSEKCNVNYHSNEQPKSNCTNLSMQNCYDQISPWYNFALAFETFDSDYISERFFAPLRSGIIPIVMYNSNKKNYDSLAPANSYIPFNQDFDTLQKLNSEENKLNKYFEWRKMGRILKINLGWFCQACGHVVKTQCTKEAHQ